MRHRRRSIQSDLIRAVLLLELVSLLGFILLAGFHENRTRFHAFDQLLASRAATLFGGVDDADDAGDNLLLDMSGIAVPVRDAYEVWDGRGRLLGRSADWLAALDRTVPRSLPSGIYRASIDGHAYRFAVLQATRIVDAGTPGGGSARPVTVRYGAPIAPVRHEVLEAVSFYAGASLLLLAATAVAMAWLLRRGLAPVLELAEEAGRISVNQWHFRPSRAARETMELAPLTAALETALARLRRSFDQQRRLTGDAAHELKTDLAIAKSSLQLLTLRERTGDEYRSGLERCLEDTERVESTVSKMLTLARVEHATAPLLPVEPETCDAAACLRASERQLGPLATLRGIALRVEAARQAMLPMRGEDFQLIATNLLLNALQHSPDGGAVHARLVVTHSAADVAAEATLIVADGGRGIAAEALPHIFEPFFRGDQARDRRNGGTGLGLAICKGLVEAAGGTITIRSEPGVGTEVRVCVPVAASVPARSALLNVDA